jgi:hypothetical protein
MSHPTGTMKNAVGFGKPGEPIKSKPNLGEIILDRYEDILHTGFEDLERFDLIDSLQKPVLEFTFSGTKKKVLEVYELLSSFPYAFIIRTKKGYDLWNLPERGVRNAYVHISRFPKLIKFIKEYEDQIPSDLWGIIYGYSLPEVHQFTYDWEAWNPGQVKELQ